MRHAASILLLVAAGCVGGRRAGTDDEGFVPMFNGFDLTGWVRVNCAPETFTFADGMVQITGKPTGVLRTERMYENYIVELDWMHLQKGGNSGFFIHSGAVPVQGQPFTKGIEIQVLDGDDPNGLWTGHGDVFPIHGAFFVPDRPHPKSWIRCLPSEKRAHPYGQWNNYRIVVNDGVVKLEVNGKEVSGGTKCYPRKGYICLESEGAPCRFKNIRIKELPSTNPAPQDIAEADQGFESLYNGLNLRGWSNASGWISKDWILDGTDGGDFLTTDRVFKDFTLILDWRTVKAGTMEIRLPDTVALKFQSAVPDNQWQRLTLTVQGDELSYTLNGKTETQHIFRSGMTPIALKGNGEKVQFANLFVRKLH